MHNDFMDKNPEYLCSANFGTLAHSAHNSFSPWILRHSVYTLGLDRAKQVTENKP